MIIIRYKNKICDLISSRSRCRHLDELRPHRAVRWGLLVGLLLLQACGTDSRNEVATDPFWLQDGGAVNDSGVTGADSQASQADAGRGQADGEKVDSLSAGDTANLDTGSTGASDAASGPQEQFFASLQLDRIVSQDPSPFGDDWKEGRTSTLGLVKVSWNGDVGTRWLHVCAMHATEGHGSQVSFTKAFLGSIPTTPHALSRVGSTWTQPTTVDLVGLKDSHTGAMPGLGKSSHASLVDSDKDGKPGVTVQVKVSLLGDQQIYVAQRTTSAWTAQLSPEGTLSAEPTVTMEQSIVGASLSLLVAQPKEKKVSSGAPNTLQWVPVNASMTCTELVAQSAKLFGAAWPPKK